MMSTDLEKLARFIELPAVAKSAKFETKTLGSGGAFGSEDWIFSAVIEFTAQDVEKLVAGAKKMEGQAAPEVEPGQLPSWFIDSWKGALTPAGKVFRFKGASYEAAPFFRSPLLNGYFTVLDSVHVFLSLSTS